MPLLLVLLLAVLPLRGAAAESRAEDETAAHPPALGPRPGSAPEAAYEAESTRSPARLVETPNAVAVVVRDEVERGRPAADLEEALHLVPGVFAQSSRNYAQDTRVSIRGFGARAGFGIRGIRVLVDDIPTTLPDGQSEVDSIDSAFVDRIEVLRGPVSSLWGGGGGGVLYLSTREPTERHELRARTLFGSHHLSRYVLNASGPLGPDTGYALGVARSRSSGYREHARAEQDVFYAKLRHAFASGTQGTLLASGVFAPEGQDPGGLLRSEVDADREQPRGFNRSIDAGESLDQQKLALVLRHPLGGAREVRATGYRLYRDFENSIPGRRVFFDRIVSGGSLLYQDGFDRLRLTAGMDAGLQEDHRRNFANVGGSRGALTLRQAETVTALGAFFQLELDLPADFGLVTGARYDWTEFDLNDRFTRDGDHSDTRRWREWSPRVGLHWGRSRALHVYANYATSFQVPTTVELRAENGAPGFNGEIEPERASGVEVGAKGILGDRLVYDLALYQIHVRRAIVPFFDAGGAEVSRNAGIVRRRGVELGLSARLAPGLTIRGGYTYADHTYRDFEILRTAGAGGPALPSIDHSGSREPNVPRHHASAELRLERPSGLFTTLSVRHWSEIEADDANRSQSPAGTLSDLRAGYELARDRFALTPFVGLRNWVGSDYDGSLRPNAFSNRFFEPAPQREVYGGLELRVVLGEP